MSINRIRGFTLIEMMVVVALIAILAAIAMPSYTSYINRGKLRTAQADLVALSLNFENSFRGRLRYPNAGMDETALRTTFTAWRPASDGGDFTFSSTADAGGLGTTYSVSAAGSGALAGCTLVLDSNGNRDLSDECSFGSDWL